MDIKKINWWINGGASGVSVTISTNVSEPVDGGFEITITFASAVSGLTVGDFSLTSCSISDLTTSDNITFTANITPDGTGDCVISLPSDVVTPSNSESNELTVTVDQAFVFLTNPSESNFYYEFRELVGDSNTNVLLTDPALRDLSGNSRTLSLVATPTMTNLIGAADVATDTMALRNNADGSGVSIGETGSAFLNTDFSIFLACRTVDGRPPTTQWAICGNNDGSTVGLRVEINTTGFLVIRYQGFVWTASNNQQPNAATGVLHIDIHFDFTNDQLYVYINNSLVSGSFTTGSIAATNPASYSCTTDFYIGTRNNNGSAQANTANNHILYIACTHLRYSDRATIYSYLTARKATFELVDVISDANFLKYPHDVIVSADGTKAYVSGKGSDTLATVDGSFAIIDITDPTNISVLGGYANAADQVDGETVLEISSTRVLHFVDDNALLFDVSNPASPSKIRTVANGSGVVNGAVIVGNRYIIGANKGGTIDVFDAGVDLADIDTFTLVGSYNAIPDMGTGPHDVDVSPDGDYIVVCSRPNATATYQLVTYQVMNSGSLISLGSWAYASRINNASLADANRCRWFTNGTIVVSCSPNFATVDGSNPASISIQDTFDMTTFSSGLHQYRNRWSLATWQVGLRLLNINDPTDIIQTAGYYNDTTFTTGNASFHDLDTFEVNGVTYVIVSAQSSQEIAVFRINRFVI